MWWFTDARPTTGNPEGTGGFGGGFLLLLFFGTVLFAISVGVELLVKCYRLLRSKQGWSAIQWRVLRLAMEVLLGSGLAVAMLPPDLSMTLLSLGPMVLAWTLLIHFAVGTGYAGWSQVRRYQTYWGEALQIVIRCDQITRNQSNVN